MTVKWGLLLRFFLIFDLFAVEEVRFFGTGFSLLYFIFDCFTAFLYFFISSDVPDPIPRRLSTARIIIKTTKAIPTITKMLIKNPLGLFTKEEIKPMTAKPTINMMIIEPLLRPNVSPPFL